MVCIVIVKARSHARDAAQTPRPPRNRLVPSLGRDRASVAAAVNGKSGIGHTSILLLSYNPTHISTPYKLHNGVAQCKQSSPQLFEAAQGSFRPAKDFRLRGQRGQQASSPAGAEGCWCLRAAAWCQDH